MNIVVTVNDTYIKPLFIMLESLFHNETNPENIKIYLLYSKVSPANRRRMSAFIKSRGGTFIPVFVEEKAFDDAPVLPYLTKEMYYRYLCYSLLPETEERALYLDPDILIRRSIAPLYDMDFEGKELIAIPENMDEEHKAAIGLDKDSIYVNSGVLLFNLKKMRESFNLYDFISILEKIKENADYPDQDVMNLYFKDEIKIAECTYNYGSGYVSAYKMILYLLGRREIQDPVIVHYRGTPKPWNVNYYKKYFFEYYSYLKKYLGWKGRLLYFFKPCYVAVNIGKTLLRIVTEKCKIQEK